VKVPALIVWTVHTYVAVVPDGTGPVEVAHETAPPEPAIFQVTVPLGATALADPETVAVKVSVPPSVGVPEGTTAMVGIAGATRVVLVEAEAESA